MVEIGPGLGALTRLLLARLERLDVVEIDRELAASLASRVEHPERLVVHATDALDFDFGSLATMPRSLRVVGNLPYNVSTPLLFHLLEFGDAIKDVYVMLQREVVERMTARPGGKDYGRLTVMLAPWFEARHLFDVGPGAFTPAPRVWSAVARLVVRREPAFAIPPAFALTVSAAFSHRRKTLRNALRSLMDASQIVAAGIDPGVRPETLTPAEFAKLAAQVP